MVWIYYILLSVFIVRPIFTVTVTVTVVIYCADYYEMGTYLIFYVSDNLYDPG